MLFALSFIGVAFPLHFRQACYGCAEESEYLFFLHLGLAPHLCLNSVFRLKFVKLLSQHGVTMTEWLPFEEEEMGLGFEDALGPQLGAGLSEMINASVQQSLSRALAVSVPQRINQAVLAALKPLTQQFDSFVKKQGLALLPEEKVREGPETATTPQDSSWPHDGSLSALAKASADHVYCYLPSTSKGTLLEAADSSNSDSTSSKSSHSSGTLRKRKRARKSSSSQGKERSHLPSNPFQFNPEDIINPRSADWAPAQALADYLHDKLRKGFDKEV
ncbi:hypothetical protein NDU88_006881 [Pleurodeles waltl]|uniref:Uncharacterized protein n=1 Tax=Pleurodeles waltl TaxID=8319 RepID=A0AAV7PRY3_PLEWA|nr:hypothetical protein NDU88_006881 [Pleurodeles waltl]